MFFNNNMKQTILILYYYTISLGVYIPFLVNYLRPYYNVEFKNITNLKYSNTNKYICIIPTDVPSMEFYNRLSNSKFTCSNKNIYKILDNKDICTKLVKKYKSVKHIPTLYKFTRGSISKFILNYPAKKYILKLNNGEGSFEQKIISKNNILTLNFNKYTSYILQPYITNYYIYSYDAIVKEGYIISELFSKIIKKNGVKFSDFFTAINCEVLNTNDIHYPYIKQFANNLLNDLRYTGFIEIEFLITKNNIYFLEINPRMCGHISQLDNNYNSIYFNKIVIPYLEIYNIHIPKHKITNNIISGTNPVISLIFFYKNYKYTIIILFIISVLIAYYFIKKS